MIKRRLTKVITIGKINIGGGNPIPIQSMTNTITKDIKATIHQIRELEDAGCDIVRVSLPDMDSAYALKSIKAETTIPIIADIHFDYKIAINAIANGADGIRINPGNIGDKKKILSVVSAAKEKMVPIRIGVNSGSIEKEIKEQYRDSINLKRQGKNIYYSFHEAMVESALKHIRLIEDMGYDQLKISLKGSDIIDTISAYRLISKKVDYPLHIGITEAGTIFSGTIKSSVGIGILLNEGIGDTLRVSLSSDPVNEVRVGIQILKALGLRKGGINIISCPTCSRTEIDVIKIASEVERRLFNMKKDINIAIMGCVVNGPGEASHADIGIAGGKGIGVLYKDGHIIKKVETSKLLDILINEIETAM